MDTIFKEWEEKLSKFSDSVEKDLAEIRKCKAEIQQMRVEAVSDRNRGQYVRDEHRIVISAPEIIIGNVDRNGTLLGNGSTVIIRGSNMGIEGSGEGGTIVMRAPAIRQVAEDPGVDGNEHVVYSNSEVVSQARNIVLQSDDVTDAFFAPIRSTGGSGISIHADQKIDIHAEMTAESREKQLGDLADQLEKTKKDLKDEATAHKEAFKKSIEEMEKLIEDKDKLTGDFSAVRTNAVEIAELNKEIVDYSAYISNEVYAYADILSQLAEVNRQIKCFKAMKGKVVKGEDFKKKSTGAAVSIVGEAISLTSVDGENNLRDNKESGIAMTANSVSIASVESDGKLKKDGKVSVKAKNIEVATAGEKDVKYENGKLTKATYDTEGDFTLKSKNITFEAVDYEVKDNKFKEKQLTADSKIKLRAKTIEVSTEGSANIEVDDKGKITKGNYTAEGDINIRTKNLTVESTDNDIEDGKPKEKALTADSKVAIRAQKMDLSATDTEGKATGSVNINAKAVAVKSMDVEKEKRTDDKLAEGSTMTLVSEKMFIGAKSKDVKSKKVQAQSEEIGLFADKTFEAQQGEAKAALQLADGKAAVGGDKTDVFGETTINNKAEVKGELKAPKASIDSIEAKSSFKSPNISDGMAAGAGGGGGKLSAKMKAEDAPKE